jgi:hypothetical protein
MRHTHFCSLSSGRRTAAGTAIALITTVSQHCSSLSLQTCSSPQGGCPLTQIPSAHFSGPLQKTPSLHAESAAHNGMLVVVVLLFKEEVDVLLLTRDVVVLVAAMIVVAAAVVVLPAAVEVVVKAAVVVVLVAAAIMTADADAVLLPGLGSTLDEETTAVLVIVPGATDEAICTTSVNSALPLLSSDAAEQITCPLAPTAGVVHVQPAGDVIDTNVISTGSVSVTLTTAAGYGPLLETVSVKLTSFPAAVGTEGPPLAMDTSAGWITVLDAEALLSAESVSTASDEIVAVLDMTVPAAAAESTRTVRENSALPPLSSDATEQEIPPPAPTAGVEQDQPAGALRDWNVVPAGTVSERETFVAGLGPALLMVIV